MAWLFILSNTLTMSMYRGTKCSLGKFKDAAFNIPSIIFLQFDFEDENSLPVDVFF